MSDRTDRLPPEPASLDDVLITDRLAGRPSRPPDLAAENHALAELAAAMADAPEALCQRLAELALGLCRAESAGVSMAERGGGPPVFRWVAAAGAWARHAGGTLPRDASPCGVVVERDAPLLFDRPGRRFPDVAAVAPEVLEALLVPVRVGGEPTGTVWAALHSPGRRFDAEDLRLLTSLSAFAAAARQVTGVLRDAEASRAAAERDTRSFADGIVDTMRDPLLVLDADLRVVGAGREFYRTFDVSPEETEGKLVYELGDRQWDIPELRTLLEEILPREATFRDFEVEHTFERIGRKVMLLNARRVHREDGGGGRILLVIEDVTERRDAEEARREAEVRFTEMVKNVRDHSIFLTDPEGVVTSWNVAAERVIGYTEAEAVGRHFSFIFAPEDVRGGVPEWELRQAREEGRAEDERWHVRKGGELFWALGIVTPLREPGGRLTGYSKILRDMTDRKRDEEALRESESRLRSSLTAARMGVWTWDAATGVQTRDANLNRLLGLEPVETSQPLSEFFERHVHPGDRDAVAEAFEAAVERGRALNLEFRVILPDGEVRWLRDQGDVFGGAAGEARMAGACINVTELKQAERALRESEERLRLIVEGAVDYGILTQAPDRTVTSWSPGAEAVFGYTAAEMIGRPVDVLFTEADRAADAPRQEILTALREGRAADERWHRKKGGAQFYASGVLTPLGDGSAGFVKILRDLTDRKRMEDDLRRARDELERRVAERTADLHAEIERRKDLTRRLASAQEDERRRVSRELHDSVGQLLAGLSMSFKAMESEGPLPPAVAGRLAEARSIVDSLGSEVHGLAVRLRPTELDDVGLGPALAQLVAEWSSRCGVRADFDAEGLGPGRLPKEIETSLYRVVQEALTNVAKHARASFASVVAGRRDGFATVFIEDDGVGFDPGSLPRGRLGLVGMRERAALVGGELGVESAPGAGTTVYVRIPIPADEGGGPAAG